MKNKKRGNTFFLFLRYGCILSYLNITRTQLLVVMTCFVEHNGKTNFSYSTMNGTLTKLKSDLFKWLLTDGNISSLEH
jgi:hypothetical protein